MPPIRIGLPRQSKRRLPACLDERPAGRSQRAGPRARTPLAPHAPVRDGAAGRHGRRVRRHDVAREPVAVRRSDPSLRRSRARRRSCRLVRRDRAVSPAARPADSAHRDRAGTQEPDRPRAGALHSRPLPRARGRRTAARARQSRGAARRLARRRRQRGAREPRSRPGARVGVARGRRRRRRAARRAGRNAARGVRRRSRQPCRRHGARSVDDGRARRPHHRPARRVRPQRARKESRDDSRANPRAEPVVAAEIRRSGDLRQSRRRARGAARRDGCRRDAPGPRRDQDASQVAAGRAGGRSRVGREEPRAERRARRAPGRQELRVRALAALARRARRCAGRRDVAAGAGPHARDRRARRAPRAATTSSRPSSTTGSSNCCCTSSTTIATP